jgi:D-alanine transaminase
MPELANINGRICAIDEAFIPAEDRGALFGDGVYEVLRCYQGRMWAFGRHFRRFERSLREIAIQNLDLARVSGWIVETYEKSTILDGMIYFHATRGVAPRSHVWNDGLQPAFFMTVRPFAFRGDGNERGIRATSLPDLRWGRCDIKSLNLLPNVMAKQQARNQGFYEAILVDERGRVREGTSSAVFCIMDGTLRTAPDGPAILPSITGQFVFEIAKDLGIPTRKDSFFLADLYSAEEAFIAGTGDEIMGITSVDGKTISTGNVGERTRRIYREYQNRIARNQDD